VHNVRRGDMPLRETASGTIVSLHPPRAILTLSDRAVHTCKAGQAASGQTTAPTILSGKIVSVEGRKCEIEFSDPLPVDVRVGEKLGALVETGILRDVIFFERPADASANSDAFVFVIEPDDQYARRVSVHYGQLSGSLIQVVSGLSPGDRVIVTDTSKWNASPRIHLR
jgi:hypothetical protein